MNTINETEKVLAAMKITERGILTKGKYSDLQVVRAILPNHYEVKESNKKGSIHCVSAIGIKKNIDAEDDEHWEYIVKAIEARFKDKFQEISHNICFCHTDFTIYLRQSELV